MAHPTPPPEDHGNGAADDSHSPMDRFRKLTKDLSGVDPEEVREAERRDREARRDKT